MRCVVQIVLLLVVALNCSACQTIYKKVMEDDLAKKRAEQLARQEAGELPNEEDVRRDIEASLLEEGLAIMAGKADGSEILQWIREAVKKHRDDEENGAVNTLLSLVHDPRVAGFVKRQLLRHDEFYGKISEEDLDFLISQAIEYYADDIRDHGEDHAKKLIKAASGFADIEGDE